MKTKHIAQSNIPGNLGAAPPTWGVAILNKEKFPKILKLEAFND